MSFKKTKHLIVIRKRVNYILRKKIQIYSFHRVKLFCEIQGTPLT